MFIIQSSVAFYSYDFHGKYIKVIFDSISQHILDSQQTYGFMIPDKHQFSFPFFNFILQIYGGG